MKAWIGLAFGLVVTPVAWADELVWLTPSGYFATVTALSRTGTRALASYLYGGWYEPDIRGVLYDSSNGTRSVYDQSGANSDLTRFVGSTYVYSTAAPWTIGRWQRDTDAQPTNIGISGYTSSPLSLMSGNGRFAFGHAYSTDPDNGTNYGPAFRYDVDARTWIAIPAPNTAALYATDDTGTKLIYAADYEISYWVEGQGSTLINYGTTSGLAAAMTPDGDKVWMSTRFSQYTPRVFTFWTPMGGLQQFDLPANAVEGDVVDCLPDGSGVLLSSSYLVMASGVAYDLSPLIRAAGGLGNVTFETRKIAWGPQGFYIAGLVGGPSRRAAWVHLNTVPEPSELLALGVGAMALSIRRRRCPERRV